MDRSGPCPSQLDADSSVRSTDSDALVSRSSAATLGYFSDPFASLFLPPALRRSPVKRPPLINIGTHARTWAVDRLVQDFLLAAEKLGKPAQVLSVGAGTDTRYWRMRKAANDAGTEWRCRKWVEIDFVEATSTKARVISMKNELKTALGGPLKIEGGGTGLSAPSYELLPGDLRSFSAFASTLLSPPASADGREPLLDPSLPTLLLAECVLVYLPVETTEVLLSWMAKTFSTVAAVSYDPFGLNDNFGKVMLRNLATRNLSLPAVSFTPTLDSLSSRFTSAGFDNANSVSIRRIREKILPPEELSRSVQPSSTPLPPLPTKRSSFLSDSVARLEMIDEVEELNLVLEHYAITWSSRGLVHFGLVQR